MTRPLFSPLVSVVSETNESRALERGGAALAGTCLLAAAVFVGVRGAFEPWRYLLFFGFSVYFAGKGWTLRSAARRGVQTTPLRVAGYLLLWPGMDAGAFLDVRRPAERPSLGAWAAAAGRTALGAAVLFGVGRLVPGDVARGWVALLGFAWFVVFGGFHLLALAWQRAGVRAEHLFRAPLLARSLGELWGDRWNRGYRDLARLCVVRPLRRRIGPRAAAAAAFAVSGVLHDLLISHAAGAGYGLPTLYFALQGAGVLLERGPSRVRTVLVALPTVFLLFHPAFLERVFLPWMATWGAFA